MATATTDQINNLQNQVNTLKGQVTALQQRCQRLENALKTAQAELARVKKG